MRTMPLLFLAALAAPVASQVSDSAVPRDTALERRVHEIASNLRCPVCQGLSILDSPSELAQDMKRLVQELEQARRRLAAL